MLGAKAAAYSNLIQIIKAKTNAGFVPNWAAGGSKAQQAEPAVGSRVLLDLFNRFHDAWLVELLFDDLFDWSEWQWAQRRVVGEGSCCGAPGFITVGSAAPCSGAPADCVGAFKGESGLDQSPKWDCVGAAPDGSGGTCEGMAINGSAVLQLGETQSSSLFVADADALAVLAGAINRTAAAAVLQGRANAMRAQLGRLWDPAQGAFADIHVDTGAFSNRLTPTVFYPLLGGAGTGAQVGELLRHLYNASEFCVSGVWEGNPEGCYWGLPSVSASDAAFMQPQNYIYWRGLSWGPMALLTWWSLRAAVGLEPGAEAGAAALAAQKGGHFLDMWQRNRHVCENYSPYPAWSQLPPGTNGGLKKSNGECTGWEFYTWGALNGLLSLLEAEARAAGNNMREAN